MPQQQTYADTPLTPDQVKAAGYTDAPLSTAHPWTADYPKTAAVARSVVNALPGIGGVVGTAIAGPETAGLAAIPAAALGVGVGRGLRDLIAEGLGLDKKSSPMAKAGRITLDTTEAAAAQAIIPGLWEAIRTPGKTIGEIVDMLPARLRPNLPQGAVKAPAALLQRPAWQTWSDQVELPSPKPAGVTALSGQTGTSMTPGVMPQAGTTAAVAPASPGGSVPGVLAPPAAEAASTGAPQSIATAPPSVPSPQQALNEQALAARRAAYQASQAAALASGPKPALLASETKEFVRLVQSGKTQKEALAAIQVQRELQSRLGLSTPTAAETRFPKGMRGKVPGDDE